ncbi:TonB-dependent receptor [Sphingobacterium faecium]|uniref:TonB-dependent receptor n=1 Tax=Sphingobacterium faecium TaxID=34087 RepID=UPI002479A623|nr:TonB-dependent receptor [Sphingobacterium faecium]WGQ14645.1 carboxypeptidase regulatory-like domain-containing protein [Sphingobacterium faecium]
MKRPLLFFALVLSSYGTIHAQVTTSSVTGIVKGSSGQVTSGATIKATHVPSGTVYSSAANAAGRFNLANMRVGGPYKIVVTFIGQQPVTYENIYLQLGEPFVLNPIFGNETTNLNEVVVTGRNTLKSEKNGASTIVGRRQIENLPSISRSVNDLTRLTPQANGTAIGGGNYRANNFSVDGANFNNQFGIGQNIPANGSPISIDAIEQISVNVTPYDVRQSGFTGGAVNAVTRSGRNDFFGSAFYTGRSDKQQGTRVNDVSTGINDLSVKQYGVSLGGPIIKNKLFFFVNLEQSKTTEPGPTKVASLNAKEYNDPNKPSYLARPTLGFMDSVSNYLRENYGYETGPYQGYSNKSNNDKLFARLDWNISNNHKLNFKYNQVKGKSPSNLSSSSTGAGINTSTFPMNRTGNNALSFQNSNYFQETNLYSGTLEYTGKIGQINQSARISYVNQDEPRSVSGDVFPLVDIRDGIAGSNGNVLTSFGTDPFTYGNLRSVKTWTANYDLNYTYNNHDFTAGLQFETSNTKNGFQRFGAGYYMFNSWDDFKNGAKPVNYALTYPLTADGSQAFPSFKFNQYSLYLQDQFTVNEKLKITGGIRFELPSYPDVSEMKTHPLVADLTFENGLKLNTGAMPKTKIMISPRLGFNYDVLGDRSLMLRGGTGVFTGRIPFVWIVAQSGDAGMLQSTITRSVGDPNMPSFSPDIKANYPSNIPQAGTFIPSSVSAMDVNLKFPSTWKSSLALDYKLPWNIVGTLEAIYNKDINAVVAKNVNLVAPTAMAISGYDDNRFIYPNSPRVGSITDYSQLYINKLDANGLVSPEAKGQFTPTYMTNAKGGHYYSITAQLQKNFDKGFSGMIAYTFSAAKNFGDGSGDQIANLWSLPYQANGNSNNPELSYTSNIVPHRLMGSVSYTNNWIGKLNTSMTLFYSGSSMGRYSYYYGSDFNRDLQTNDLIYIPSDRSQLKFTDIPAGQSNYGGKAYTAQQQADLFWSIVDGDDYLKSRIGKTTERNGAIAPWRHQFDFRLSQELFKGIGGKNNSLEFFWDVMNIGNLFNSSWGIYEINNNILLTPQNTSAITPTGTTVPTFRMGYANGEIIKELQRPNETISSTYYMQFGVKFKFN